MTDPSLEGQEGAPATPGSAASAPEPASTPPPAAPEAPAWGAPAAPGVVLPAPAAPAVNLPAPAPVVVQPAPAPAAPAAPAWGTPAVPAAQAAPGWGTPAVPAAPAWGAPAPGGAVPGWGAPPQVPVPLPRSGSPNGMRTTLAVAAIMIGVVFGVNVVNAAVPLPSEPTVVDPGPAIRLDPNQPTQDPDQPTPEPQPTAGPIDPGPVAPGAGLRIGAGVVVYPPDGWTVVGNEGGVTVLQKGGVVMIVAGIAWGGTPLDLLTQYRDVWFEGGQFAANQPESGKIGNGVPGAILSYAGVLDGTQVEGIIGTGATGGAGVVINVFGAQGSITRVSADINAVFDTVQFTGEPG